jgi:hypothetical protein
MKMGNDRGDLLRGIFTDPRLVRINRWLGYIADKGVKIGAVTATLNPGYFEYALNKDSEGAPPRLQVQGQGGRGVHGVR